MGVKSVPPWWWQTRVALDWGICVPHLESSSAVEEERGKESIREVNRPHDFFEVGAQLLLLFTEWGGEHS